MKIRLSMTVIAVAITAPAITFEASADDNPAYWVGSDGDYARGGSGYCLRTINWTPEKAIAGCEGGKELKAAPAKIQEPAESTAKAPAPAAVPVDDDAEPQYRNLSLASGATFELGGSTLSSSGKQAVAGILKQFEGEDIRSVLVEGHTDDRGVAAFNQQLSEKRANAVRDELIANGVDPAVIKTRGFGESRPVADNGTREGRAQNRRVEIKVDAMTRQL